jgi:hypothetical protein
MDDLLLDCCFNTVCKRVKIYYRLCQINSTLFLVSKEIYSHELALATKRAIKDELFGISQQNQIKFEINTVCWDDYQ